MFLYIYAITIISACNTLTSGEILVLVDQIAHIYNATTNEWRSGGATKIMYCIHNTPFSS
jgi:hypothetical protein